MALAREAVEAGPTEADIVALTRQGRTLAQVAAQRASGISSEDPQWPEVIKGTPEDEEHWEAMKRLLAQQREFPN